MFCREQVAQLGGVVEELDRLGVGLVVVGLGSPAQAREFQAEQGSRLPLYVDPGRRAYQAFGLSRGLLPTLGPATLKHALRALAGGYRQGPVQGDPWQQGGVVLLMPDGSVPYAYRSKEAGDHPAPEALLEAARRAVGR